jgi:hypothetical protein
MEKREPTERDALLDGKPQSPNSSSHSSKKNKKVTLSSQDDDGNGGTNRKDQKMKIFKPNVQQNPSIPRQHDFITVGVHRTNSFPSDMYSGARFNRFQQEEALRNFHGTSIMDWLKGNIQSAEEFIFDKDEKDAKDHEKRVKAQHLESFDYDFFESR